jgi:hypothetical protein
MHRQYLARLAGTTACVAVLLATATASAETVTYTTPGRTTVTLPPGVASVHVVAVGGRGGGVQGGYGAVVTADLNLATASGLENPLRVFVGGNGAVGAAGENGGGAPPPLPSLAAGGGGWSGVSPCVQALNGSCSLFLRELAAGGGGGAGADGLPGTGGAGGSAGSAGAPGSATAVLAAAAGGGGGGSTAGTGGSGGVSSDSNCVDGDPGETPSTGIGSVGGEGGLSGSSDGHGDGGGGGGGGSRPGGGGGAGAWCVDDTGASGAGGGGGNSIVPSGGQLAIDATGLPSVTLTYEQEHPTVSITTPADGAVYAQGRAVMAAYGCSAALPIAPITSCSAPVPAGSAIDTAGLGLHTFAVSATDALGMTAGATVQYRVTDQTRPTLRGLRIAPSAIHATGRRAFATVRFRLSEAARVRVSVERARRRGAHATKARARVISGKAGANSFRLRPRIGRRVLAAGAYRLTLVAIDAAGNRSRAAKARFTVIE